MTRNSSTVVLQSQRAERLDGWQGRCCASVQAWATQCGYAYRFEDDEVFKRIPDPLRQRFGNQVVVLSDFARLLWMQEVLGEGYARVLWIDADVLLLRAFEPPARGDWLGREAWVQVSKGRLRSYRKVQNAWLQIGQGSSFLPFYIDRARCLLERAEPPVVPQFIGPKLLTAWHNLVPFNVEERVGMCSPVVMRDLLRAAREGIDIVSDSRALDLLRSGHGAALCALNLCASYEGRDDHGICHAPRDYHALIDALLEGRLDSVLDT